MKIRYQYSESFVREMWAKTGQSVSRSGEFLLPDVELNEAERRLLLKVEDFQTDDVFGSTNTSSVGLYVYRAIPHSAQYPPRIDKAPLALDAEPDREAIIRALEEMVTSKERAEADLVTLKADFEAWKAAEAVKRERERAEREAEQVALKAKADAEKAERLAWIAEHGSPRLKKCIAHGYDCTRLYEIERAAVEFPGWAFDYNDTGTYKERSGPTLEALEALEAAQAQYPQAEISIVWLTGEPTSAPGQEADEEWEPREALLLERPSKHDLFLVL